LTAAYTARAATARAALSAVADEMRAIGALRYATEAAVHAASAFRTAGRQDAARCRQLHERGEGGSEPTIEGLEPGPPRSPHEYASSPASRRAAWTTPRSPTGSS